MKRIAFLLIFVVTLSASVADARTSSREELVDRVWLAEDYLEDTMLDPDMAIPEKLIADAYAIVIVQQFKAGFIFGVKGGAGVGMLHNRDGSWSPPAFYHLGAGSVGLQLGAEHRWSIYLIMSEEGTRLLTGDAGEIGVDFAAVAGPRGASEDLSNFDNIPILVYSSSEGLFAGASVEGGVLSPNDTSNQVFYDNDSVTALEILESNVVVQPESESLMLRLQRHAIAGGAGQKQQ